MKKYIGNLTVLIAILFTGCNDSFLEKAPETSISPKLFFKTTKDLELYVNTFYDQVSPQYMDYVSDNCASYADVSEMNNLIRGSITEATVGGWNDWGTLRRFNFFLENAGRASGDQAVIDHYIGIARLQRANWYYNMVKRYSDVPWYSTTISDVDEDLLYKERDPRSLVVDSIMRDLDYAVEHISEDMGNRTQYSKWYAYSIMARICLHEGTFRKYHDELNLQNTANEYLEKAVMASQKVMSSEHFSIDKTGGPEQAYWNLFANYDLSKSPEMILFKDYDTEALIKHPAGAAVFSWITNYSRSLMESYQYIREDGKAVPFSTIEGYNKKSFTEVFKNRDPRLKQTFMYPGYVKAGESTPFRANMNLGGYPQIKFVPGTADQVPWGMCYTDLPVLRYAEILLINAEAKAELGTIKQEDVNKTINEIRSRVAMPPIMINEIIEDPDLKAQFPGINNPVLLEIRRERRIELVSENFRWDDLVRWKAGYLIEKTQQGIYIDKFGVFDVSGDGKPDVGIFENEAGNTIPESERGNYIFYYLKKADGALNTFSLSNGNSGYIVINGEIGTRAFKQPQYYYFPIPQTQLLLNSKLKQTNFW